jgi:prepilin-type N-terminal cleavage/methylation domain-containing protein
MLKERLKVKMNVKRTKKAGFTLVEIMIVVAIIGLLAAIAIPNFVKARQNSQTNACINNLRQIDGAKQQYALEQGKTGTATAPTTTDIQPYLGRGSGGSIATMDCPLVKPPNSLSGYGIGDFNTAPTCSNASASHAAYLN